MAQVLPLQLLSSGEQGRVCDVSGDAGLIHRLDEIGVRVGTTIRMIQPGSPCIVGLGDQRLSFRGDEAAVVFVEPDVGEKRDEG